jgi:hypothetical protein
MNAGDYFLPLAADAADLHAWSSILPPRPRVLRTNLFGDAFLVDGSGAVHLLERGAGSIMQVAISEEQFWRDLEVDAEGWQLRPLADKCRASAKMLGEDQCYAFMIPPLLGGDYVAANVWVAPWREWFSLTADLFAQAKTLPDGTAISLKVVD